MHIKTGEFVQLLKKSVQIVSSLGCVVCCLTMLAVSVAACLAALNGGLRNFALANVLARTSSPYMVKNEFKAASRETTCYEYAAVLNVPQVRRVLWNRQVKSLHHGTANKSLLTPVWATSRWSLVCWNHVNRPCPNIEPYVKAWLYILYREKSQVKTLLEFFLSVGILVN